MTEFIISNDENEIKSLISKGFVPVECSIGGKSIVDDLKMDHHNELSNLEGVALRAYRDHYGECADAPGFVISGNADADATFAVASLMGIIPHPNNDNPRMKKDLSQLAETINYIDTHGLPTEVQSMPYVDVVMTWNAMTTQSRDNLGFVTGVGLWRNLLLGNPAQLAPFLKAPIEAEKARHEMALEDLNKRGLQLSKDVLAIRESTVFGFPEWYERAPIVVALTKDRKNITLGVRSLEEAERLLGKGGLKNVLPKLQPSGWGGRETIGGSPRGIEMSIDDLDKAGAVIVKHIHDMQR